MPSKIKRSTIKKNIMSPKRWRFNYVYTPLYGVATTLPLVLFCFIFGLDEDFIIYFCVWIGIFLAVSGVYLSIGLKLKKQEVQDELQVFSYLFEQPNFIDGDEIVIPVEEDGITYTFHKDGLTAKLEDSSQEGVFEEVDENTFFAPWEDVEFALGTQSLYRRVQIAVAVVVNAYKIENMGNFAGGVFALPPKAEGLPPAIVPFVLPMSKPLFTALMQFGLMDKIGVEFEYLFYNPEDAFKQIIEYGRVLHPHDKKDGMTFDEYYTKKKNEGGRYE